MKQERLKILIIEDDPLYAKITMANLELTKDMQFEIKHADRLSKGLTYLAQETFDAIISDLSLPDSSGEKTVESVFKKAPTTPIIVLTSNQDELMGIKAVQAGAHDYLLKNDADRHLLVKSLRYAIARNRLTKLKVKKDEEKRLIRVLLVDDSLIALGIIKKMLHASPEIQVVGTAVNGKEAYRLIPELDPDVVCTDYYMPEMNGFELVQAAMKDYPRPILVISTAVQKEDKENIFKLLEAGAVDVFPKPKGGVSLGSGFDKQADELVEKIKSIANMTISKPALTIAKTPVTIPRLTATVKTKMKIICIGASVGGPQALKVILPQLPASLPVPIICIQIIHKDFLDGLIHWLESECQLKVKIAEDGKIPEAGTIYFSPGDKHLEFNTSGRFHLTDHPPIMGHRPSINTTFLSIASYYKDSTCGVILSGLGKDGIEGMQEIFKLGGLTIVQDQESCLNFQLPKQVIDGNLAKMVMPLLEIASTFVNVTR